MGASQSSRKITVVNDEATGVIKISDAVVQRLKGIKAELSTRKITQPHLSYIITKIINGYAVKTQLIKGPD